MSDDANTSAGFLERPDDAGKGKAGLVALWLDAIALAGKEESDWRDSAADAGTRARYKCNAVSRICPIHARYPPSDVHSQ